jgi:hypothetical protein
VFEKQVPDTKKSEVTGGQKFVTPWLHGIRTVAFLWGKEMLNRQITFEDNA